MFEIFKYLKIIYSIGFFDLYPRIIIRARGGVLCLFRGVSFHKVGRLVKIRGANHISVGRSVSIGDFCWIEAITYFSGIKLSPKLVFGAGVSLSDSTHISCASHIHIGENCLIGSKVYIGDHSHGSLTDTHEMFSTPPAKRPLGDIAAIDIGKNSWICDGVVILAGTRLAPHSIVGANSVVRLKTTRPALIAGAPAKVIRYFD